MPTAGFLIVTRPKGDCKRDTGTGETELIATPGRRRQPTDKTGPFSAAHSAADPVVELFTSTAVADDLSAEPGPRRWLPTRRSCSGLDEVGLVQGSVSTNMVHCPSQVTSSVAAAAKIYVPGQQLCVAPPHCDRVAARQGVDTWTDVVVAGSATEVRRCATPLDGCRGYPPMRRKSLTCR